MFTKTALKKMKKADLVDLFLDQQARVLDDKMDDTLKAENEKLKAENEEQSSTIEKLDERLGNLRAMEKDITLHPDYEILVKLTEQNNELKDIV